MRKNHFTPEEVREYVLGKIRESGLSLPEVGRKAGYHDEYYAARMLAGHARRYFTWSQACRLSAVLGVSVSFLTAGAFSVANESVAGGAASPRAVLDNLFGDLSRRGITAQELFAVLGYASPQSVYSLRAGGRYLSEKAAARFARVYGYNMEYLMTGRGSLTTKGGRPDGAGPEPRRKKV